MTQSSGTPFFDWKAAESVDRAGIFAFVCEQLLNHPRFQWVGVYWIAGTTLVLRAWDGPEPTPHVRIPIGEGICGLAARTGSTVNVGDVDESDEYLACFASTKSELVVPVKAPDGTLLGEIDVDSDEPGRFSEVDVAAVEKVAAWLGERCARPT